LIFTALVGLAPSVEMDSVVPPNYVATTTKEWIQERIQHYSDYYNVSEITLNNVIGCESGYNPNARNISEKEDSNGLVQINLKAHPDITIENARDVEFSLDFLARMIKNGKGSMWTCFRKN
jgi:hypothetical protein